MAAGVDLNVDSTWQSVAAGPRDVTFSSKDVALLYDISGNTAPASSGILTRKGEAVSLRIESGEELWLRTTSQHSKGVAVVIS